ncbi:MAG TPA: SRPBCC family protein [Candidatus Sulfomarinibacteraceae bacterium]|nr:SRPBCC family protein [Candidatus Sulfomarinibacteraceae bacterium]
MIEFENSLRIDRPIDEVFAFISDFENVPKWNYFVLEVTKTSEGPVDVGTTYHQIRKTDEQDFRVIEFQTNQKIAVKTLPKASPQFRRRFTLQAEGSATYILDEWELDTGKPALIEKLGAGKVKSAVGENLSKLKSLLETGSVILQDGREENL